MQYLIQHLITRIAETCSPTGDCSCVESGRRKESNSGAQDRTVEPSGGVGSLIQWNICDEWHEILELTHAALWRLDEGAAECHCSPDVPYSPHFWVRTLFFDTWTGFLDERSPWIMGQLRVFKCSSIASSLVSCTVSDIMIIVLIIQNKSLLGAEMRRYCWEN